MDLSNQQKKKKEGCFTLKCSVIVSYLISLTSNLLLVVILFLTDHGYKWPGLFSHILVFIFTGLSLKALMAFSKSNLIRYQAFTKYFAFSLAATGVFYVAVLIYMLVTKTDMDLIYYLFFCIAIWCVFHGLFISIIHSFIKALEDRPNQGKPNAMSVDKNLRDLMLSSNSANLI